MLRSFFPLEPKLFFLQNHPFQAFLSGSKIYIFIHGQKSNRPSGWGGVKALADAFAKNASFFFDVFPGL